MPPPDELPLVDVVTERVGVPLRGTVTEEETTVGTAIGDGRMHFGESVPTDVVRWDCDVVLGVGNCGVITTESTDEVATTGLTGPVGTGDVTDEEVGG